VRRALARRFPYAVFYLVERDRVVVLAVLHQAVDPARWPGRP
jgi:toxin ParE1/3/4